MTDDQTTEPEVEETEDVNNVDIPPEDEGHDGTRVPSEDEERSSATDSSDDEQEPDTFPRSVVEKLRKENAGYREKAKKSETYARELFHARVAATGRLADPDDLPFDEDLLDDRDALLGAVEDLLARKPHLASRTPRGDVGQGQTGTDEGVDLAGILRSRA